MRPAYLLYEEDTLVGEVPPPSWWPGLCPRLDCGAPLTTNGPYLMPWCERGHPIDARPRCPVGDGGRLSSSTRRICAADEDAYDCGHIVKHDLLLHTRQPTMHDQVLAIITAARTS